MEYPKKHLPHGPELVPFFPGKLFANACSVLTMCLHCNFPDRSPQFKNIEGAVLIFLPGLAHIQQLYDLISTDRRFNLRDR